MRCPNCEARGPIRPVCPRCGMPLGGEPVPLTSAQEKRLRRELIVPFAFLALVIAAFWTMVAFEILPPPGWMFWVWLAAMILFSGHQAIQLWRDLRSGVALTREDLLKEIYRSSGKGGGHYYGRFEQLGSLRLGREVDAKSPAGRRYRIVYSPASKIVWTLDPA